MTLRIITGSLKGREIWTAKGVKFRPSTQFLRERLFSILGFDALRDSTFLDVFAGSGIVGFEAISRGARKAIFLELNYKNVEMIKANAERLSVTERVVVLRMDATRDLRRLSNALEPSELVNIVFIDPPFDKPVEVPFLEGVLRHPEFFSAECAFYLETRSAPSLVPKGFSVFDQRRTSSSVLTGLRFTQVL